MLQRPQIRRALRPGADLAVQEHPGDSLSAHAPEAHDSPPRGLPSACALNFGAGESPPSGGMDFLAHARVPPSPPLPGGLNLGLPTNSSEEEPRVSASRTLFASYPTEGARTSCGREASVADEAVPAPTPEMPPPPPPASSHEPDPKHHHAEDQGGHRTNKEDRQVAANICAASSRRPLHGVPRPGEGVHAAIPVGRLGP